MKTHFYALAAVTLDGKIARSAKHFTDWTSKEDKKFMRGFLDTCDAVIVGRNTYEIAKKPLSKRNCIVFTRKASGVEEVHSKLAFCNPTKNILSRYLSKKKYKKICILGGTQTYTFCLQNGFLDELFLTIEPVVFGSGLSLFDGKMSLKKMKIISTKKLNREGTILIHARFLEAV